VAIFLLRGSEALNGKQAWFSHTVGALVASCVILNLSYIFWDQMRADSPAYSLVSDLELAMLVTLTSQLALWLATKFFQRKSFKITFHLIVLTLATDVFLMRSVSATTQPLWLRGINAAMSDEWQRTRLMFVVLPASVLFFFFLTTFSFAAREKSTNHCCP
jgi:hypothetical protein